jgi:hypothetical protein
MKKSFFNAMLVVTISVFALSFTKQPEKKNGQKFTVHYCYNTNVNGRIGCSSGTVDEVLSYVCLELGGRDLPNQTVPINGAIIAGPNCETYTFVSASAGAVAVSNGSGTLWAVSGTITYLQDDGVTTGCITLSGNWYDGCIMC